MDFFGSQIFFTLLITYYLGRRQGAQERRLKSEDSFKIAKFRKYLFGKKVRSKQCGRTVENNLVEINWPTWVNFGAPIRSRKRPGEMGHLGLTGSAQNTNAQAKPLFWQLMLQDYFSSLVENIRH